MLFMPLSNFRVESVPVRREVIRGIKPALERGLNQLKTRRV
jgi:hypothetical protein